MLIRIHAYMLVLDPGHADLYLLKDDQRPGRAQLLHAGFEQGRRMDRADTGTGFKHRRAVGFLGPHSGRQRAGLGHLGKCPHLLALDRHVQVMRRDASTLEPCTTPDAREQRIELAEVGRAFDRAGPKSQRLGHLVIMQRGMPAVLLIGQHLTRRTKRAAQDQRCVEAHEDSRFKRRVSSPLIVCR